MSVTEQVRAGTEGKAGPLVAIALELARRLDDPDEKSPAPVAKELRAVLADLAVVKAEEERDPIADARSTRTARRRKAAAPGS